MKKEIPILMMGPSRKDCGGIASVINVYFNSNLISLYQIIYLSTSISGSKYRKCIEFLRSLFLTFRHFISSNLNIVHLHSSSRMSFFRKSILLILSKLFRKKVILHIHGSEFEDFYYRESGAIKRVYIRYILTSADILIALSNQWKENLIKIIGPSNNIRILFNCVSLPDLENCQRNDPIVHILFAGRLGKRKGVFDLLKAAKFLINKTSNVKFYLAGDGEIELVKEQIRLNKLDEYFDVLGWINNTEEYLSKVNIFVLPSYNEGLPMSILEAASYGLPIVSTSIGGIPEVVVEGVNGYLIKPGDIEALNERLLSLVQNKDLRERMGMESLKIIRNKFNINSMTSRLDHIYKTLLIC